jgi:hypothetical protein
VDRKRRAWILASALSLSSAAWGQASDEPLRKWFLGNCQYDQDPASKGDSWYTLCIRGKLLGSYINRSEDFPKYQDYTYGEAYMGLHLGPLVSIHGRASQDLVVHPIRNQAKNTESFFLQLGNSSFHRRRATIGKFQMPFGINDKPLMQTYYKFYKTEKFWETEPYAARLTFDDLATTQLDLSVALDHDIAKRKQAGRQISADTTEFAARFIHDISALGGTRFAISWFEKPEKQRRLSLGMMTINRQEATASLEWVRQWNLVTDDQFEQLIRFDYYESLAESHRWLFEYEDQWRHHWITTLGYDYQPILHCFLRLSASYYRSQIDKSLNHWFGVAGLEVNIR